ncbi:MAG: GntR family transcriptional regulator [Planctomycetota bacterium]|jgi:DNA-binding transcriptional regulator YhcF (GntR family)
MTKYEAIYKDMLSMIKGGKYKVGDKFLTEVEASEKYGVTHITARGAFKLLIENGYVTRMRKKGTFIISLTGNSDSAVNVQSNRPWVLHISSALSAKHMRELLKPFLSSHQHIKLNIILKKGGENLISKLHEDETDSIHLYEFNDATKYKSNRMLQPLPFLNHQTVIELEQDKILRTNTSSVSSILGVPIRFVNRLPVVNITLAAKLGLDTANLPETWAEVENWCEKAVEQGVEAPISYLDNSAHSNYEFHCYMSDALRSENAAGDGKLLIKEPFIKTMKYFSNMFKKYSRKSSAQQKINVIKETSLFNLFAGPWFFHENRDISLKSEYAVLKQFVPEKGAINYMYSTPSYIGLYTHNTLLSEQEQKDINDFYHFFASPEAQEKVIVANRKGYPSQTVNTFLQNKIITDKPEEACFYRGNFIPLHRHSIPCYETWYNIQPEIKLFFDDALTIDELWEKVDWLQNRPETEYFTDI